MTYLKLNSNDIFGEKRKTYDDVPVAFCSKCLSLKVLVTSENEDYCDNCGGTEVEYTDIKTWSDMAAKEFGDNFIIKNKFYDGRD
jgi:hypothetical protein